MWAVVLKPERQPHEVAVVVHASIQIEMKQGAQAQGSQMFGCDHRRELLSKYAIMRCRKDGNKSIFQKGCSTRMPKIRATLQVLYSRFERNVRD